MSVAKIERDIKLIENKLTELDTTIADPIERNEQKKDLEKKIKKLRRTKSQTEQLEKERLELESLKTEFTFNKEPVVTEELEASNDNISEIEAVLVEPIPSVSAKLNLETPTSDSSNKSKNTLIISGIFGLLLLSGTLVAINDNEQFQFAGYAESQMSEPVEREPETSASDLSEYSTQGKYLSNSYSASNSSESTSRRNTIQNPITKKEAVSLVNQYLQAKSEILSPPFDRQLASEILTGKALHDVNKPNGSIDWLIDNSAYYTYGQRNAEPLALFWSNNNNAELDVEIYEEYYFYKNNRLVKSNKYSDYFNFKFQKDNGVWKINDKSSKK